MVGMAQRELILTLDARKANRGLDKFDKRLDKIFKDARFLKTKVDDKDIKKLESSIKSLPDKKNVTVTADTSAVDKARTAVKSIGDKVEVYFEANKESLQKLQSSLTGFTAGIASSVSGAIGGGLAAAGVGTKVGGLALGASIATFLGLGFKNNIDKQNIQASINSTFGEGSKIAEQAGRVAGRLYTQAYGDSLEETSTIAESVFKVFQNVNLDATGKQLENLASLTGANLSNIVKKYELSFETTVAALQNVLATGLTDSVEEANDLIASLARFDVSGESVDVLKEYSTFFDQLGFSAQETFNILRAGGSEGAFNLDKVADGLKELSIINGELTEDASTYLEVIGLNGDEVSKAITSGGGEAKKATLAILAGISQIEDSSERFRAGQALLGTQYEDIGRKAVEAMGNANKAIQDVYGAASTFFDLVKSDGGKVSKVLEELGLDSEDLFKRFKDGPVESNLAFDEIIEKLKTLDAETRKSAEFALFDGLLSDQALNTLDTFTDTIKGTSDQIDKDYNQTFAVMWETFKRSGLAALGAVTAPIFELFRGPLEWLSTVGVERLNGFSQQAASFLSDNLGSINLSGLTDSLSSAAGEIQTGLAEAFSGVDTGAILAPLQSISEGFGGLFDQIDFTSILGSLEPVVTALSGVFEVVSESFNSFLEQNPELISQLQEIFGDIAANVGSALEKITPFLSEIGGFLADIAGPIILTGFKLLGGFISGVAGGIATVAQVLTPVVRILRGVLTPVIRVLAKVIGTVGPPVIALIAGVGGLSKVFRVAGRVLGVAGKGLSKIGGLFSKLGPTVSKFGAVNRKAFSILRNAVGKVVDKFLGFKDKTVTVFNSVKDKIKSVIDSVKSFIQGLIDKVQALINKFNVLETAGNFVSGIGGAISEAFAFGGVSAVSSAQRMRGVVTTKPSFFTSEFPHTEVTIPAFASSERIENLMQQAGMQRQLNELKNDNSDRRSYTKNIDLKVNVDNGRRRSNGSDLLSARKIGRRIRQELEDL